LTEAIHQREAARRDLVDHLFYLAENAGLPTAERFLSNAESSFSDLAQQPLVGSPLKLQHPALSGLRKWRIMDFDNYFIFYEVRPGAVSIVRVLHAASDWWGLLGIER
jgi:toxin ParE1/3/4